MLSHLRNNVVGYLALVVALSGTSYAAVQLSAGQVKTQHLANGAVTAKKIKNKTVTKRDLKVGVVKNGAVAVAEVKNGIDAPGAIDSAAATRSFSLPRAGQVYLRQFFGRNFNSCTAGTAYLGLYVDEVPVPGTFFSVPGDVDQARAMEAVGTVRLSKGVHTATVGVVCPAGQAFSSLLAGSTWTVLLLG
ncbi:MAG TPA: hypothetical protein VLI04_07225 [Nocardioidaceae bacterium]|nr:hypothetical protein [Nocardioidaceae bacterium]